MFCWVFLQILFLRDAVFNTSLFKFFDGADAHFFPEEVDLFRTKTFDVHHFENTLWRFGNVFLKCAEGSGVKDFDNFFPTLSPIPLTWKIFSLGMVVICWGSFFKSKKLLRSSFLI